MKPDVWMLGMVAFSFCSCASVEVFTPEKAPEYMTGKTASFFIHGPQQPGAPDKLPPETFVKMQRKESGYSVVQLEDGRTGYIANDDIRIAPPSGRSVSDAELFPEKYAASPAYNEPEPDLSMPVLEVPDNTPQKKTSPR